MQGFWISVVLTIVVFLVSEVEAGKSKPPAPKAIQTALAKLRMEYATQYSDRTPSGRASLLTRLKTVVRSADSDTDRYIVLQEAAQVAAESGDVDEAFKLADELGTRFDIDLPALKGNLLNSAVRFESSESWTNKLCGLYADVAEEALDAELYNSASSLLNQALTLSRQVRDAATRENTLRRVTQLRDALKEHKRIVALQMELSTNSTDAKANLAVGSYWCFLRGDWQSGLPYLKKSSDSSVVQLAEVELNEPTESAVILKLADDWWAVSEKTRGTSKDEQQRHAAELYRQVVNGLAGNEKQRVEKRISSAAPPRSKPASSVSATIPVAKVSDDLSLPVAQRAAKLILEIGGRVSYRDSAGVEHQLRSPTHTFADVSRDDIEITSIYLGNGAGPIYPAELKAVRLTTDQMRLLGQLSKLEHMGFEAHCAPNDLAETAKSSQLIGLSLTVGNKVHDEHLSFLSKLDRLVTLGIVPKSATLTGDYLTYVPNTPTLKMLLIGNIATPLKISSEGLKALRSKSSLTSLGLVGSTIEENVIDVVRDMSSLETLTIASQFVPRLNALRDTKSLRRFSLSGTTVRSNDLEPLAHASGLTELTCWRVAFLDGGFKTLGRAANLEKLNLAEYRCDSRELLEIGKLRNLKSLRLSQAAQVAATRKPVKTGSGLTDDFLAVLTELSQLEELFLTSVDITPDGLRHLEGLNQLKTLQLQTYGQVSDADLAPLRKKLPGCQIRESSP